MEDKNFPDRIFYSELICLTLRLYIVFKVTLDFFVCDDHALSLFYIDGFVQRR